MEDIIMKSVILAKAILWNRRIISQNLTILPILPLHMCKGARSRSGLKDFSQYVKVTLVRIVVDLKGRVLKA